VIKWTHFNHEEPKVISEENLCHESTTMGDHETEHDRWANISSMSSTTSSRTLSAVDNINVDIYIYIYI